MLECKYHQKGGYSMTSIQKRLLSLQDPSYRSFQCALMPTVSAEKVIGVRTPILRKLAKEIHGSDEAKAFLSELPHRYYEENNLHAFLIEYITDYGACIAALNDFLPFVDNWATCDSMNPRILGKEKGRLTADAERWISSGETYTIRFGIKLLMTYFLDKDFDFAYPSRVAKIQSEEYYVNMMIAWYFATALSKRFDDILPYLSEYRLSPWIHRKTIQKAMESYRITKDQKRILRSLP